MLQSERRAVDDWSDGIRARALAHVRMRGVRGSSPLRIAAISAAILLHLIAVLCLYLLMRPHPMPDEGRIEVRLLDAAAPEPSLPEPPVQANAVVRAPIEPAMPAMTSTPPEMTNAPAAREAPPAAISSARLFNSDGSVRLPPAPPRTPHEEGIERARELLARGHNVLRCARGTLVESSGPTINERAAKAARVTRLLAFATSRSWEVPAQRESQVDIDAAYSSDSTIENLTMIGQDCDDAFYRRPPPKAREPRTPR
ncbi:MAG: hypothetical protein JSS59_12235 [Proteobacteria bacterium]|uniref:hypothetical protein n=1 Tax=Rudaea sp. TaxID=2136325 RepID=UPI003784A601|nr:hypothetical protein [Pseudomonadota bacterium]